MSRPPPPHQYATPTSANKHVYEKVIRQKLSQVQRPPNGQAEKSVNGVEFLLIRMEKVEIRFGVASESLQFVLGSLRIRRNENWHLGGRGLRRGTGKMEEVIENLRLVKETLKTFLVEKIIQQPKWRANIPFNHHPVCLT